MEENDLTNLVISLFEKMRKILRKNEKAADYNSAPILIDSQNEWMSNRLTYFASILHIFYAATSNFCDLQIIIVFNSFSMFDFFARVLKSEEKYESSVMIEKIMRKIGFYSEFIEKLKQKSFLIYFFRVFDEIEERDNDAILLMKCDIKNI